jgi:hypothetical protein
MFLERRPGLRRVAFLFCFGLLSIGSVHAQSMTSPTVTYPASSAVSGRVADFPEDRAERQSQPPRFRPPTPFGHRFDRGAVVDTLRQNHADKPFSGSPPAHFPGVGANGNVPPDPNIAVGPNHIVQTVNTRIAVYSKTGVLAAGYPKSLSSIWTALGGACATNNAGDPIVQYDRLANRWLVFQIGSLSSPYSQCYAISTSGDPTGSYNLYSYNFGSNLPDYGKFGVWPKTTNSATAGAYLATYNLFANAQTGVGAYLCAMDRAAMIAGSASPALVCYTIANDYSFLPVDLDGATPAPDSSPAHFITNETDTSLRLYKMTPNFVTPSSSTLSAPIDIPVASYSMACGGGTCIPQRGTTNLLDSLGDRLMYRFAYRNFGSYEAFLVNHAITSGAAVGIRWYELRNLSSTPLLYQSGTFAPNDGNYRWMGSMAMDKNGDIALGYSISGSNLYPSVNVATRLSTDPLGQMSNETQFLAGTGAETGPHTRWGDYSAMRIDPSDDCTFWYSNEYYTSVAAANSFTWSTMIGSLKLSGCGATASTQPLTVAIVGSGTVTSNPAGISCSSGSCTANFSPSQQVQLTAQASAGSTFTGWSGGGCGSASPCVLTVSAPTTVTANFNASAATNYMLSITKTGVGTIKSGAVSGTTASINCGSTCSASFPAGSKVTLTESPGFTFSPFRFYSWAGWGGACASAGRATSCTVTMTGNLGVSGSFR